MLCMDPAFSDTPFLIGLAIMLVGLVGVFLPVVPGVPLMLLGAFAYAWLTDFERLSGGWLALLSLLTVASLLVDVLATAWAARRMGASRRAATGAAVGTLLGVLLFGAYGSLAGGFTGAVAGDLSLNRPTDVAFRSGAGAFIGFLIAIAADLLFGLAILGLYLALAL